MSKPITVAHGFGVTQIDADYLQAGIACVYLLRQGDKLALIETGTVHTIPQVLAVIKTMGLGPEQVEYVIPTHVHLDHAGGAGAMMAACPNARLVVHPRGARHLIDPAQLEAGTLAVYGEATYRKLYGKLLPVAAERIITAPDNFQLDFNGRQLTFMDTPGHASHHFCVYDTGSNSLFTGDTFGISYRALDDVCGRGLLFVTTTPVQFDPHAMSHSIQRLVDVQADRMFLTHYGSVVPTSETLGQLTRSLDAFVAIAEQQREPEAGRVERIEAAMMEWVMAQLDKPTRLLSDAAARQWLRTDMRLNAQGLDVWLARNSN